MALATLPARAGAQAIRTQDVGFSVIHFDDNLPTLAALSLNEAVTVERERSSTVADGVLSLFHDGRWSMEGSLAGTRFSPAMATSGVVAPWFRALRGEFSAGAATTAQQGNMPTFQLLGTARAHLLDLDRGAWAGVSTARSFDGEFWRTTLYGEAGAWVRRGTAVATAIVKPLQTTGGDLLSDFEGSAQWTRGAIGWQASGGYRAGLAVRSRRYWLGLGATFLVSHRWLVTATAGSYPEDLIQGLPGGRYVGLSLRLPSRPAATTTPATGRPAPARTGANAPLPSAWEGAVVAFVETPDSGSTLRLVRIRAPGAQRVEISGDFTDWNPAALVRGRLNYWELTLRIPRGTHRFNVRVDGREWVVPANLGRVRDEFTGEVAVLVVP